MFFTAGKLKSRDEEERMKIEMIENVLYCFVPDWELLADKYLETKLYTTQ